jgi:hypothetical protein
MTSTETGFAQPAAKETKKAPGEQRDQEDGDAVSWLPSATQLCWWIAASAVWTYIIVTDLPQLRSELVFDPG